MLTRFDDFAGKHHQRPHQRVVLRDRKVSPLVVPPERHLHPATHVVVEIGQLGHEGSIVHVEDAPQGLVGYLLHQGAIVLVPPRVVEVNVEVVGPAAEDVGVEEVPLEEETVQVGGDFPQVHGESDLVAVGIDPGIIGIVDKVSSGEHCPRAAYCNDCHSHND